MSGALIAVKDSLQRLLDEAESSNLDEATRTRLRQAANVVVENEKKIWMRTSIGKPMLESLAAASEAMTGLLKKGAGKKAVSEAMDRVEAVASLIAEESRRRSMVVT